MFSYIVEQARRFRRITTSGKYSPEVDGVRFVAIGLVLFQHMHERLGRHVQDHYKVPSSTGVLETGYVGVSIFFALSGYILYRQLSAAFLERGGARLKDYYIRRVTRLEPPYIVVTTILCLAALLGMHGSGTHFGGTQVPLGWSYLATLTYTHQLIFGVGPYVNPLGWTLEIEVQFYLVAPLLAYLLTRCRDAWGRVLIGVVTMLLLIYAVIPNTGEWIAAHDPTIRKLPLFFVGIIFCDLRKALQVDQASRFGVLDLLGLAALVVLVQRIAVPGHELLCQCALIFLIVLAILDGRWVRAVFSHPIIATIGGMCYTIYLTHLPIMELACNKTSRLFFAPTYWLDLALQSMIVIPIVIGIAFIFYALIERPCMNKNWPRDLWAWFQARSGRATVPSAIGE